MTDSELLEEALTALCLIRTLAKFNGGSELGPCRVHTLCEKVLNMAKDSNATKIKAVKVKGVVGELKKLTGIPVKPKKPKAKPNAKGKK